MGSAPATQATMATEVTWQPSRGRLRKPCFSLPIFMTACCWFPQTPTLTPSSFPRLCPTHQPDTPAWPHHSPLELPPVFCPASPESFSSPRTGGTHIPFPEDIQDPAGTARNFLPGSLPHPPRPGRCTCCSSSALENDSFLFIVHLMIYDVFQLTTLC